MPFNLLLIAAILILPLAACAGDREAPAPQPRPLIDREWTITAVDGAPLVAVAGEPVPTLTFTADAVAGNGGVNGFGGSATIGAGTVTVGPLRSTRRAGPPALMDQETAITRALAEVRTWTVAGGSLLLRDADGAERLRAR